MPTPALIATQLTTPGAGRTFVAYLGGLEVGRRLLVETHDARITENGPGQVSTFEGWIDDPDASISLPIAPETEILIRDAAHDLTLFAGFVTAWTPIAYPGGVTGRELHLWADGLERILDDAVIGPLTLPGNDAANGDLPTDLCWLVGQADDALGLIAITQANLGVGSANGDATAGVGTLKDVNAPKINANATVGPGTLRQGIDQAIAWASSGGVVATGKSFDGVATVDFLRRLRVFFRGAKPDDYTDLAVSDTAAGLATVGLAYEVHPREIVRSVYVAGVDATASGWIRDGSGIRGKQAYITSSAATSANRRDAIGALYLAAQAASVAGSFDLQDYGPTVATVHPQSLVSITDAAVGLAAQTYTISRISKLLKSNGLQDWTVNFGGRRASFVERSRREFVADSTFGTFGGRRSAG